jgi:ubiquinone/menaquinone biosynthesis C-methylase UbiE
LGFYQDRILPRFQDRAMARKSTQEPRARACAGLSGDVVEVGFGTGLNALHYPPEVVRVFAVEPSAACMRLAEPRIAKSSARIELAGGNGEHLDFGSVRRCALDMDALHDPGRRGRPW